MGLSTYLDQSVSLFLWWLIGILVLKLFQLYLKPFHNCWLNKQGFVIQIFKNKLFWAGLLLIQASYEDLCRNITAEILDNGHFLLLFPCEFVSSHLELLQVFWAIHIPKHLWIHHIKHMAARSEHTTVILEVSAICCHIQAWNSKLQISKLWRKPCRDRKIYALLLSWISYTSSFKRSSYVVLH